MALYFRQSGAHATRANPESSSGTGLWISGLRLSGASRNDQGRNAPLRITCSLRH